MSSILDDKCSNKIRMHELHDKFYELYDKFHEQCDTLDTCNDIENNFFEVYIWFVHYNCTDYDLKYALELYDNLVYEYEQFNNA